MRACHLDEAEMIRICASCERKNRVPTSRIADAGKCGGCGTPLPPLGAPIDVDAKRFAEITSAVDVPVLVDFWAPWCGPCRTAAIHVTEVAKRFAGRAIVLKVNTEDEPGLARKFGVRGIPHFAVLNRGQVVKEQTGLANSRQLGQLLDLPG